MANRAKTTARLESDIQIARDESNWRRVIDLAEQLRTRSPHLEILAAFLIGEGKLESYLLDNPPLETSHHKAKIGLNDAKKYLVRAAGAEDANSPESKAAVSLDAYLLLGKLSYACGNYEEAVENFRKADLENLAEKNLPCRSVRIVAESFAIRGICLEKNMSTRHPKFKQSDAQEKIDRCMKVATDLTFLYLQELDDKSATTFNSNTGTLTAGGSYSPQPPSPGKLLGAEAWRDTGLILHQLLMRNQTANIPSPNKSLQPGQVQRLRYLLSAEESNGTQCLRLNLAKNLADLLMRGYVNGPLYQSIEVPKKKKDGAWKPKKNHNMNMFIPNNEHEETILLLLISEAMAVRNAVLSQSPEFKEQRLKAFETACTSYNLLIVCLARWGQTKLFHECLERGAIKFSFDEPHTWHQYALSLISIGEYAQSLRVMEEHYRMNPHAAAPCLMAAKVCYANLKDYEYGIKWSQRACESKEGSPYAVQSARSYMMLGIGYHLQALYGLEHINRTKSSSMALEMLQKAQSMGPGDHLIHHYLALVYAHNRRLPEAISNIKQALNLRSDHAPSLNLLCLLLTAQKQYQEAMNLVVLSLEEWPDSMDLLYLKSQLELHLSGPESAKATASKMLMLWKKLYEDHTAPSEDTTQSERRSESRSLFHLSENGSNNQSRVLNGGGPMSVSSVSSLPRKQIKGQHWDLLAKIWLLMAELCLHSKQREQGLKCIDEAVQIHSTTPDILIARGLISEMDGNYQEAKNCFEGAASLEPNNLRALQQLAKAYLGMGKNKMAEFFLWKAAKLYPQEYETWHLLGLALEQLGDHTASADCMVVALDVENSSPLVPFASVGLAFE
ncbi:tetratricopeptide repeat protein 7B [Neocloeon triangulifer]|uniref:tetratricopeptide repeat protein 7B n=1 Tax=Neocloeon triangulifer TaxID=2078957 RepID=UPI00286F6859|nr:tetratricopeptide repeat protein 7B [Neocloeon triangulifer]